MPIDPRQAAEFRDARHKLKCIQMAFDDAREKTPQVFNPLSNQTTEEVARLASYAQGWTNAINYLLSLGEEKKPGSLSPFMEMNPPKTP